MKRKSSNGAHQLGERNTPCVQDVLEVLAQLVPQIARSIANDCEVALHDNRTSPPRILAIGNGHVTRRTIGDLMTRIAIGETEMHDMREPLYNYSSIGPDGRQLRVSLLPIMIGGKTIAYLAINYATGDLLMAQKAIAQLTRTEPHPKEILETFLPSSLPLRHVISRQIEESSRPPHLLDREDRIELVRRLHGQGVFQMRGAVRETAARLGISRTAVYYYLKLATGEAKAP
ncbi:PAS domain-containing protein (plasmid) [Mesorhizobium mediterraneum]|uniref:helix-turn-helix transcriptional regulator n=2 Tax=Mesorhizobium mediterraneum TaxID=43617 RepID=UPI00255835D3|nr:PAS domain-containing protein [Mesorhizobium mediterraneum]WIW57063.1 PAS domain-containing protein [Mesorhizobium mediterraneum]